MTTSSILPESWRLLKNMMRGDVCLVMGNGPSLADVPISFLNKYDSFSANNIFLLPAFRPKWYLSVNPLVIEQSLEEINALDASAKFIATYLSDKVPGSIPLNSYNLKRFSLRPWDGIYEGYTVTFVALQLAYALGYNTVLLVGVDHRYTYDGAPNEEHVMEGADPNHFHPDYFRGKLWNNPDLHESEKSYWMAKHVYENNGRRIINLGPDSSLDIFPRGRLEDWLE